MVPVLLLGAGCSDLQGSGDLDYVPGDGQVVQVDADERGDVVDITGTSLDGDDVDLGELRGRIVVLNVWGSWCNPCRAEAPRLVEAQRQLDDDAAFVGLFSRADNTDAARAFEREYGITYPTIDDDGESLLALGPRFAPRGAPNTILLDRTGRVAAVISGAVPSATTLVQLVEEIAAEDT